MSCEEIEGTWIYSLFVSDDTEDVIHDGSIRLGRPDGSGLFTGEHLDSGDRIEGRCSNSGPKPRIEFTRHHTDGRTTTEYLGRVAYYSPKDAQIIVKGRFRRTTQNGNRATDNGGGDWTTEKPT